MNHEKIEADLNYDNLTWLARHRDKAGMLEQLTPVVNYHDFERTEETDWAYLRVLSFLDDGWTAGCGGYVEMRSEELLTAREVGQIVNPLIGGTSPNEGGEKPYVFDTPGGHAAALLFFCATLSPDEAKELLDKAS